MTIKKKTEKTDTKTTQSEDIAEAFIKSGGKASSEENENPQSAELLEELIRFTLRIPREMIDQIDSQRKNRIGKVSRNNWILEAISEKIKSK